MLYHDHGVDPDHHIEQGMGGLLLTITVPPPLSKRVGLTLVSRLELASGAAAMRYEPRR